MDDEVMVGEIACQILEFLGYEAVYVDDGIKAVDIYRDHLQREKAFSAVVMDLTVPGGMGGKDAVIEILALDPSAKVIVSSGHSGDPIMTNFKEYGFIGSIGKPFDMAAIESILALIP